MPRKCSFMVVVEGEFTKFYSSFAIDRFDAIAQMREIYGEHVALDVVLFQHV